MDHQLVRRAPRRRNNFRDGWWHAACVFSLLFHDGGALDKGRPTCTVIGVVCLYGVVQEVSESHRRLFRQLQ